jgi:release factor glutamine methyltransferase
MDPEVEAEIVARLRAAGCVYAEEEAALLVGEAPDPAALGRMVAQRVDGLPLEQVLGWAEFCGLRIAVDPGVFVPRRRTALLARLATAAAGPGSVVIDLCCGSGALAAAVRAGSPEAEVYAADLDPAAVRCARRNLPPDSVFEGDLYAALPARLRGRVDVLVVNAPYVPTDAIALMPPEAREHEHRVALDGGVDGLEVQRGVVADAPRWLGPGGLVLVETSPAQAPRTLALMRAVGLAAHLSVDDEVAGTCAIGRLGS